MNRCVGPHPEMFPLSKSKVFYWNSMKLGHSADRHNVTPKFEKQNYQRDPSIPELRPLNCLNLMGGVHRCFALKAKHFLLDLHETHKA